MILVFSGLLFVVISIFLASIEKFRLAVAAIAIAGALLRIYAVTVDPFLNTWDEQFHALVAKNLSVDMLHPKLYSNPVLDYDFKNWTSNSIWLHKQPLFLWMIGLSIKLFGTNALAVRIPSLVLMIVLIPVIFRVGHLVINIKVGYYAALLFSTSGFLVNFVSGQTFTDHNDLAFMFFTTCSIWTFFEYKRKASLGWAALTGVFCGCAVLNKWLVGMLLLLVWMIFVILDRHERKTGLNYIAIFISGLVSLLIIVPWQIYAFTNFTKEYVYECSSMAEHFFNVIEGHGGGITYHIRLLPDIYGWTGVVLAIFALLVWMKSNRDNKNVLFLLLYILGVYAFYSLAATKMPAFTIIACCPLFIIIAYGVDKIFQFLKPKIAKVLLYRTVLIIVLCLLCFSNLNYRKTLANHSFSETNFYMNHYRKMKLHNTSIYINLGKKYDCLSKRLVIFNCIYPNEVEIMFYTNFVAYPFFPTQIEINRIKEMNYQIAVFNNNLPDYMAADSSIIKIDDRLIGQP